MKKFTFAPFFLFLSLFLFPQSADSQNKTEAKGTRVALETNYGKIVVLLYNDTPKHRDNFLKLVKNGTYDGLLFHRVIRNFMIQGGDPDSRTAKAGQPLGSGTLGYTIPAEFRANHFHKKGALCAARQGDNVNPKRESSASQFYIVQGNVWNIQQLNMMEQQMGKHFTAEQRKVYTTLGGTPHLDGEYTVFGEVVEGMEVVDRIASVSCDRMDRPIEDVRIKKATVID
ncbi:MAG: peptidylprolyl isomerase [Bacteroidales bacterium]|nr:peptidylprolyl isomerase [Bacteroidales bacterium]